jgi:AraC-like DNA-binding protein
MNIEPRVSAVAACGILGLIGQFGGDCERIFGAARLDLRSVLDPAGVLDLRQYCVLFEQAARQTGVDDFGLRFGRAYPVEAMGKLAQLALNSPTLGAALRNLCRYFPALQETTTLALREEGGLVRLEYQIRDGRIAGRRQDAELSVGIFNNFFRRCLGPGWAPEEVHFEHLRAAAAGAHQAVLGAPVYFAQGLNAILFRPAALAAPMPGADATLLPGLHAALSRRSGAARPDDFLGRVVQEIRAGLAGGAGGIEPVAARLGLSRAGLYRRLAGEGVDFSQATEAVRRELAVLYVAEPGVPLTEIAALLGYSELSAFSRAFKRWMGVSAAAYRRGGG